jgi:ABC-type ATPase with predicted acetyltransferase domain
MKPHRTRLLLPTGKQVKRGDVSRLESSERIPPIRSDRAAEVAKLFGLPEQRALVAAKAGSSRSKRVKPPPFDMRALLPRAGAITLITGPSGAGKSSLLRRLKVLARRVDGGGKWIDLTRMPVPMSVPVVDCFDPDDPLTDVLLDLGRVGLGEAWSYLRTPRELSEGQRWRLRLALAIRAAASGERSILVADEFAALLDRITAAVVARCLRRTIASVPCISAIVATSHEDLTDALKPETIAYCDFGRIELTTQ